MWRTLLHGGWYTTQGLAHRTKTNGEGVAAWSRHIREREYVFYRAAAHLVLRERLQPNTGEGNESEDALELPRN